MPAQNTWAPCVRDMSEIVENVLSSDFEESLKILDPNADATPSLKKFTLRSNH